MRILPLFLLLAACGDEPDVTAPERTGPPSVYTTFYPTTYFAERIGGALVNVVCPLPADSDPIWWRPEPDTLRQYQEADLVVLNGASFEKWAQSRSLPENRVVSTADGFRDEWIRYEEAATHKHGPAGEEHTHEGIDGHTWIDPVLAKRQAAAIRDAMKRLLPDRAAELDRNFAKLAADLDALDAKFKALPVEGKSIVATHPAWNYPARRYGWNLVNDPEADGDVRLWEGEPGEEGPGEVAFSPCEQQGGQDYLAAMHANLDRLQAALER